MIRIAYKSNGYFAVLLSLMVVGLLTGNTVTKAATSHKEYIMGVFPYLPPRELEKVFSPMAADLAKTLGKPVIFRTSSTYKKFMEQLDNQVFDIAFVQPFDYIRAADKYGYRPLATRQEKLSAILVAKQGSSLSNVKDLKNRTVSLPPEVAAVSYLIKDYFMNNNLKVGTDVKLMFTRSHVSCMQQVLIGTADACGTAGPALRFFQHKMKAQLKIIGKTKNIPHTLFSIHPRISNAEQEKIRQQILDWGKTEEGKKMLARGRLKPLKSIQDNDYNIVRKMTK